jgi:hypothetical protein
MRYAFTVAIFYCILLNIGLAQVNSTPFLQPTPLEAFAAQTTTRITWSNEISRIKSSEAVAVITALVVEEDSY